MKRLIIVKVNQFTDKETLIDIKQDIKKQIDDGLLVIDNKLDITTKHFKDTDDIKIIVKPAKRLEIR